MISTLLPVTYSDSGLTAFVACTLTAANSVLYSMAVLEISLCALLVLFLLYKWATSTYSTFKERGVPFEKPALLGGNAAGVLLNRESFQKNILDIYRRNREHKIVGYFNVRDPIFLINDPECIKKITIKDFEFFPDHVPFFKAENEPLVDYMLIRLKGRRWKDMRNTLTPVFTASKMRAMFSLMNECFEECLDQLHEKTNGDQPYEFEVKQWFTRLSNDIIASTAFGLKVNSFVDVNNEFYNIGQSITNLRGKQMLKFFMSSATPWLMKLLGLRIFDTEKTDYFLHLVVDAIKYREEQKIVRPDMIQLLLEAQKESGHKWSSEELVAQCFTFFFAAFENNTNLICSTCHELMEHPDIQQRLYDEVKVIQEELNGAPIDYDTVGKMKYMDMVVSETLRKWSFAVIMDRVCIKDYELTDEDENLVFKFKAGDYVGIPIVGLHRDERYFAEPHKYNPERFSEEGKQKIRPFTYLPFGAGPRNCIGNRYALMQAKAILYYVVLNFKLERSPKTVRNVEDDMRGFNVSPRSGFWMKFVPRN